MMNLKVFVLILLAFCGLCSGQENGECSSPDLTTNDFLFGVINDADINLNHTGVIKEYDMVNTVSVISTSNSPMLSTYIDARYDAATSRLQIYATELLAEYDTKESAISIRLTIMLGCPGGSRRLIFEQPLSEENNHDPVFSRAVYEFEVMLPLPRGFDLTFFQEVSARDLDIRNNRVHFSSPDAEGVSVGTAERIGDDGKTFYATLITSHQLLTVGEQLEFTIVATDSGKPTRSSQARVIVRSDAEDVFIPVPKFESAFYRGRIDEQRQLIIAPLRLTEETYHKEIALGFSGGDSSLFTLSINDSTTLITVSLQRPLTDGDIGDTKSIMLTTLVANRADVDPGSTVIIVDIARPRVETTLPVPRFEHNVYVGQLDVNRALTIPDVVIAESTFVPEMEVSLSGNDAGLFKVDNTSNTIRVTLLRELNALDVQFRSHLMANLTATRPDMADIGTAALLVNIATTTVRPAPHFERTFYAGRIDANDRNILHAATPVLNASTYSSDVTFSVAGTDAALFRIVAEQNVLSVLLAGPLTDEQMLQPMLTTTIYARRAADGQSGATEFIVTLPTPTTTPAAPTFAETTYLGTIDLDRKLTFPTVTVDADTFTDDVKFTLSGDADNLLIVTHVGNVVTIALRRDVTDDDIADKFYLKYSLDAVNDRGQTAVTVILIEIAQPEVIAAKPIPAFEKLLYIGELDEDRKLTLENVIVLNQTYSEDIVFTLAEGESNLFEVKHIGNSVTVDLARTLTDADVTGKTFLSAVLKADRPYVGAGATTILIRLAGIEQTVPERLVPRFEQSFYLGVISDGSLSYAALPTLNESTYDAEVSFTLTGDDSTLFTLRNELNIISIRLGRALTEAEKLKPLLLVTIVATSSIGRQGSTEFIVTQEQPATVDQPNFEQRLYLGRIGVDGKLAAFPTMRLTEVVAMEGVSIELVDADSTALGILVTDNVVSLTLSRDLTTAELAQHTYLKAVLIATNTLQRVTGTAVLIIDITQPDAVSPPQFVQNVYRGWLDAERVLTFEDVKVLPATFSDDVTLQLRDDDFAMFTATKTGNDVISIALAAPLTDAQLEARTYLTTVLHANRPDVGDSTALLLVHLHLTTPRPPIPQPQFSQPVYRGRIDTDLRLQSMENVTIVASTFVTGLTTFQLVGADSDLFVSAVEANIVQLTLRSDLTADQLKDRDYLSFGVDATHPETTHASASVIIDLPPKVCPVDETPVFENLVYSLVFEATQTGRIGQIHARVPGDVERPIRYALATIGADLRESLTLDPTNGVLTLITSLAAGQYTAKVSALDASTALLGLADLRLDVAPVMSCPVDATRHVNDTLLIKYLIENKEHLDIMPGTIGSCSFEVVKSNPDDMVYVSNDPNTKQMTSIRFDREADIFDAIAVPQIQVTLQLSCEDDADVSLRQYSYSKSRDNGFKSSNLQRSLNPVASDGRWYTLTDSLPYAPRLTHLTIIIEDENDNAPQFVTPIIENILYGYPNAELAERIMPVHLVQVRAIDRDAGLNALIRFSLAANAHFQINGETGAVTPVRDALAAADDVSLVVRATDRDGAADGLFTERTLRVRRLTAEQIVVVSVQEQDGLDAVDRVVNQVYNAVGMELIVLHAARISVPEVVQKTAGRQGGNSTGSVNVLRMFAYVVRDNVAIISATDVQIALRGFADSNYQLSAMTMAQHQTDVVISTEYTGRVALIAVCAVLGVFLLLTFIGTFLLWWYKIRPYEYRQMEESESISSTGDVMAQNDVPASGVAAVQTDRIGGNGVRNRGFESLEMAKETGDKNVFTLNGSTTHETADDTLNSQLSRYLTDRLNKSNQNVLNADAPNPPPMPPPPSSTAGVGVRFNEMVERIDIEVEPEMDHVDFDREDNKRA